VLGSPCRATIADWFLDRVIWVPAEDDSRYVTATGAGEQRTHPALRARRSLPAILFSNWWLLAI
jgi:hypothetical protein